MENSSTRKINAEPHDDVKPLYSSKSAPIVKEIPRPQEGQGPGWEAYRTAASRHHCRKVHGEKGSLMDFTEIDYL